MVKETTTQRKRRLEKEKQKRQEKLQQESDAGKSARLAKRRKRAEEARANKTADELISCLENRLRHSELRARETSQDGEARLSSKECTVEKEVHSNNSEDSLPNYTDCETEHVESADYIHYEDIKTEIIKNEHSENESYVCEMCYECFDNETGLIHHKIDGFCCKEKNQIEFKFQPMDNELTDSGTSTTYIKDELNSSSMENYKFCLVPRCYSSSDQHPDKIFVSLPNATSKLRKRRKSWLLAIGRDENDISNEYGGFVCEDHFNLEEDMVNYVKYKVMGGNILLKNDVVPHIFDCWEDTK
ncbi:hypothetical protein JTB14_012930 [Gonioctena quinquepunctata]|nr:hypothetical protein JTB14_012930 [Gonioctena quinquepunctata]